jgi:hypothetical protein
MVCNDWMRAAAMSRLVVDKHCLRSQFEYNLRPFPPTLEPRFGSTSAIFARIDETCLRADGTAIANQQ